VPEGRELLTQVARRDRDAFHRFYEAYADRVFRYALTLLRSRHLAEEVVQETMLAVWNGAATFAGRSRVSTWVFGIARHQAHNLLRREEKGSRRVKEDLVFPDPAEGVHRELRVLDALATLPGEQREVVFLTFYEGLSYAQIASILDIPEGTVKSRMYHARKRLAQELR
jgi:RNA polymerase sigma-70 factor, ECF subfamily